jgi:hypothetical protein
LASGALEGRSVVSPYIQVGILLITVPNLIVIVLMLIVFALAVALPLPQRREKKGEDAP